VRREISPEELEAVFRIAAKVPDLRQLEKDLAELVRILVAGLRTIRGDGDEVRPKTVTDLLRLNREGFISREAVAKQLHQGNARSAARAAVRKHAGEPAQVRAGSPPGFPHSALTVLGRELRSLNAAGMLGFGRGSRGAI